MILKCDFCSHQQEEEKFHRYRAVSFVQPPIEGLVCTSEDDWAACDTCHDLIARDGWDELALRSLDTLLAQLPKNLQMALRGRLLGEVRNLHEQFRKARLT
jgi:hypothetical protein